MTMIARSLDEILRAGNVLMALDTGQATMIYSISYLHTLIVRACNQRLGPAIPMRLVALIAITQWGVVTFGLSVAAITTPFKCVNIDAHIPQNATSVTIKSYLREFLKRRWLKAAFITA